MSFSTETITPEPRQVDLQKVLEIFGDRVAAVRLRYRYGDRVVEQSVELAAPSHRASEEPR